MLKIKMNQNLSVEKRNVKIMTVISQTAVQKDVQEAPKKMTKNVQSAGITCLACAVITSLVSLIQYGDILWFDACIIAGWAVYCTNAFNKAYQKYQADGTIPQ